MNPLFSGYAIILFQLNELKIMCRSENTWKRWEMLLLGLSEVCWGDPNKSAFERSQEPIQYRCKLKNNRTACQRGSSFYTIILLHFFAKDVWCQIQLEDTESCRHWRSLSGAEEMFHLKAPGQNLFIILTGNRHQPDIKLTLVIISLHTKKIKIICKLK